MKGSFPAFTWRASTAALTAGALAIIAHSATASAAAPFAAPVPGSVATPVVGTLRVTVAMILVLAALLAAAWLTRRLRGSAGTGAGALQVVAQVPLGARERAVLLRVGARQLLLGVAPGSVRTLHVLEAEPPAPSATSAPGSDGAPEASDPARPTFRSLLLRSLGK